MLGNNNTYHLLNSYVVEVFTYVLAFSAHSSPIVRKLQLLSPFYSQGIGG